MTKPTMAIPLSKNLAPLWIYSTKTIDHDAPGLGARFKAKMAEQAGRYGRAAMRSLGRNKTLAAHVVSIPGMALLGGMGYVTGQKSERNKKYLPSMREDVAVHLGTTATVMPHAAAALFGGHGGSFGRANVIGYSKAIASLMAGDHLGRRNVKRVRQARKEAKMQAAKQGSSQLSEAELEQRRNAARARWAGHTPAAKAVMSYDLEKVSYRSVIGGLRSLYGRGANAAGRLGNRAGRFMEENTKAGQARLGLSRRNSAVAAAMGRQAKEAKESAVFYERELATVGSDPVNYLRRYSQQHIMQAPIRQRNRAKLSVLHSINAAYNAGEKTGTQAALNAAGRKGERAGRAAYHAGAAATGAAAIGGAAYGATQLSEAQREQRRNAAKARWAKYGGGSGR